MIRTAASGRLAVLAGLVVAPWLATGAVALDLVVLEPAPGVPVLGPVDVAVEVLSELPVESVEIRLDGRTLATLTEPPYRLRVDVGAREGGHRFEVIARDASGATVRRVVETPTIQVDEELELQLQQLYVTVTRGEDRVLDLARETFAVRDDGETQSLVTFEQGDVPMTALLLIDASESMRGQRLDTALAGARTFLRGLAPLDQAALWLFSDRLLHASPVTGFTAVLEAGLSRVRARGGTALNDHLYLALQELARHQGRRVVVVLSDGVDVASVLSMEGVRQAARRSEAMVYWIRPGGHRSDARAYRSAWRDQEEYRRELTELEALIAASGGRVVPLDARDEIPAAFSAVLEEIRDQYVLGYYPTRNLDDGSWHRIQVRVDRSGLDVRVREGYLDE